MVAADAATEGLYVRHRAWLRSYLQRRLGNAFDAADLLHDTFLRVLRRPRLFDSETGERSYLATIAHGLCIDHWRRRELEIAWLRALQNQPPALQPSAEQAALILETLHEIDSLLDRLPAKVRQAFVLAQLDGLPYREIAERMAVSERMVKKYMAQALLHCAVLQASLDGLLVD